MASRKRNNRKSIEGGHLDFLEKEPKNILKEKQKARNLRHSAWWRKKISSGRCYYCGDNVGSDELTMDHVIPLSRGGKSEKFNLVASCKECNNKKKYLLPAEWEEYLEKIREQR